MNQNGNVDTKIFVLSRHDRERLNEFHTRVVNEIQTLNVKIVDVLFGTHVVTITYQERSKV